MKSLISRPSVRPSAALALCIALLLALVLALPAPAQAHDTLLSTDPPDGETLETSPEEITFTYSSEILDVSPLVRISDEDGEQVAEIVPTVEGPTATATLPEPLPAGTYDIQWRVVSSDGHPIEGTLTLTVEQDPAAEETPAGEESAASGDGGERSGAAEDSAPAEEPTPQDQTVEDSATAEAGADDPSAGAEEDPEAGGGLSMPVLLGVLAVVAICAVIAVLAIVRRRD